MIGFGVKFWSRISQNKLHQDSSAKSLGKFCFIIFFPKLTNSILKFKFFSFCPDKLNQHWHEIYRALFVPNWQSLKPHNFSEKESQVKVKYRVKFELRATIDFR